MMTTQKKSGMTLVEILFAFAIISTVLIVAYSSAINAWRSAVSANQRTEAQYVAQSAIEEVKAYRDLSSSSTAQKRMQWSGAANNGMGAFLQDLQQVGGIFTVGQCASGANCVWRVKGGSRSYTAPGDSKVFTVVIKTGKLFCSNGSSLDTISDLCGDSLKVTAVTLQATVNWDDANGVASNAIASTILAEPN